MATVKDQLKSIRLAPRKVRVVVSFVKGKNVLKALEQLAFLDRRPAEPMMKLLKSALANAEHNFNMVPSNLYIKEFFVDEGVKLKRFRPKAYGRAGEVQKKTSHVRLVLAEKVVGLKAEKKVEKKHEHDHESDHIHAKPKSDKPEVKTELGKKEGTTAGPKRRFFQRKSV